MTEIDRIPTNLRTLLILEVLGGSERAMTATEINDKIGLPKQTVHRLCTTLEREGFITRQGGSQRYVPARRLRDLGAGLVFASRSHIARRQILESVARDLRETVNFAAPSETGMGYLDRIDTDWPLRIQLPIGSSVPFHCTASGKCFMASMRPRARQRFVSSLSLNKLTERTHTAADTLLDELSLIAKRGYSLDDEEFMDGMVAIAVPVKDLAGRFFAALAFHAPVQRISLEAAVERREILKEGAARLGEAISD